MVFEVTDVSSAGAESDQANPPIDLSALEDLGDAVKIATRYGRRIWPE